MTRKDYEAIANVFSKLSDSDIAGTPDGNLMLSKVVEGVADVLKADNERFDRQRFLTACGYNA